MRSLASRASDGEAQGRRTPHLDLFASPGPQSPVHFVQGPGPKAVDTSAKQPSPKLPSPKLQAKEAGLCGGPVQVWTSEVGETFGEDPLGR